MEDDAGSQNNSVVEKSEEVPKPSSKKNTKKKGGKRGGKKSAASKQALEPITETVSLPDEAVEVPEEPAAADESDQ